MNSIKENGMKNVIDPTTTRATRIERSEPEAPKPFDAIEKQEEYHKETKRPEPDEKYAKFLHLSTTLRFVNEIMETDVTMEDVRGNLRHPRTVRAREMAALFMHYVGDQPWHDIKSQFGEGHSHTTYITATARLLKVWLQSMTTDELKEMCRRRAMKA